MVAASRLVVLACVAACVTNPLAAQAIYRCDDGKGGVLYADEPCQGGTRMEIRAGTADPAAIERLRRDQKAFDERHAARQARAQAEAQAAAEARRTERERERASAPAEPTWAYPGYAWGGYWPYVPVTPRPPRPPPVAPQGSVPATPAFPVAPRNGSGIR
jgi:hypothetical protein